jgi:tetratricopeptide (TPR) repeat protein
MNVRIALAALLVAAPLCAQVPQATVLFEQERFEEAKRLLAPLPNDPDALFILGKIALLQDDDERAVSILEKVVEARPSNAHVQYWFGLANRSVMMHSSFFKQPFYAGKMRGAFERAVQLDPNYFEARLALIDYFIFAPAIAGGSEEKALAQAAEVSKRDRFMGHRAYARIYIRQKKLDLARKELLDAVREQPASAAAHAALGGFYGANDKNYPMAFAELESAIRLDPNYMLAWFRIGQDAALSGTNLPRGEEALKKYLTYQPKENEPGLVSTWFYLGSIYEKAGRKPEARSAYATALAMNPKWKALQEAAARVK